MKNFLVSLLALLLVISVVFTAGGFQNSNFIKNNVKKKPLKENKENAFDYEKAWAEIDSLKRVRQYKTAHTKVDALYEVAKTEKNTEQTVKAIFYKAEFIQILEEDAENKRLQLFQAELGKHNKSIDAILNTLIASFYNNYADQNRWSLRNVSATDEKPNPKDIGTWSLTELVAAAFDHYEKATAEPKALNIPIKDFKILLTQDSEDANLRPTLYDVIAHRAIDFYTNEKNYLTKPKERFTLNQHQAFGTVSEFINTKFETNEKLSGKYEAIVLLQNLLTFHQKDAQPDALVDANLKRLKFAKNNSSLGDKNNRYLDALNILKKKYKDQATSAEIGAYIGDIYYTSGFKYKPKKGDSHKWDWKRAFEIYEEGIKNFPDSYGGKLCQQQQTRLMQKQLNAGTEVVNLPKQNILTWVSYRNVSKVYVKVVPCSEKMSKATRGLSQAKLIDELNKGKVLKTWTVDLPNDGDYHQHRTEIKVDGLPAGEFYLLISDNEYFSYEYQAVTSVKLRSSNLAYFQKARADGRTYYYVVDRASGKPLKGVDAEFYMYEYNSKSRKYDYKKLGNSTSDVNGIVVNNTNVSRRFYVKLKSKTDYLDLNQTFYEYKYTVDKNKKTQRTHFFADRGIYRPGQTIYFKGLVIEKNYKDIPTILTNKSVKVDFYDVNGQVVESKEFTTNEYGTFNGSFIAPKSGLLGQMYLRSSIGEWQGTHYFRVEEYKRPKFEVKFNPLAGSFKLGEEVEVSGNAKAYAGNNIDGAEVKYRVVRKVVYPYWRWWWMPMPAANSQEIKHGTTKTDAEGQFKIQFDAIPDPTASAKESPQFDYEISVDVIDITGETHSSTQRVSVGNIALRANITIPTKINKAEFKAWAITTKNLNGIFEAAKGQISVYPLKTPDRIFQNRLWESPDQPSMSKETFYKTFKNYPYKDEYKFRNWKKGKAAWTENFDTEKSKTATIKKKKLKQLKPGKYQVVLTTKDKFGTPIEVTKYFELFDLKKFKIPANAKQWFLAEDKSYEPKETAVMHLASSFNKIHVLYETYDNENKLTHSKWVKVEDLKKFKIDIKEEDRGNIGASWTYIVNNRGYFNSQTINVPWSNKDLKVEYQTFRDKLQPGQKEEWRIKISGNKKEKIAAEAVASMYDASLDVFAANSWYGSFFPTNYPGNNSNFTNNFSTINGNLVAQGWQPRFPARSRVYPNLLFFNALSNYRSRGDYASYSTKSSPAPSSAAPRTKMSKRRAQKEAMPMAEAETDMVSHALVGQVGGISVNTDEKPEKSKTDSNKEKLSDVKVRTNLNETVFFMPDLKTDKDGNIIVKFTMNEALTRWKFLLFAHTKDLATVSSTKEVVTQKDLMVMPNPPRFLRENDEIEFTAKVSNLSEKEQKGVARLELFDALTMKPIDADLQNNKPTLNFNVGSGLSTPLSWKLKIPDSGLSGVTYRVVASSGEFSDGEESALPVLTNRMLLTETMPMSVRGKQTKQFKFAAMDKASNSKTLKHHKATLEFTSNPAWYAVQALPYLMEYPYQCTEQIFSRYYANSLAASVTNSQPKIKTVFEKWKNTDVDALASNLSKNQELKYALLEETPWVLASQNEALQKKNIGLLFDLNRMEEELDDAVKKLTQRQLNNGGFAWFPGGRDSWYITQYLVEGMGHLKHLGVNETLSGVQSVKQMDEVLVKAVQYIDERMIERYNELEKRVKENKIKWTDRHLSSLDIHYLYSRSFYKNIPLSKKAGKVHAYFLGQAKTYWMDYPLYSQGMISLSLNRYEEEKTAKLIVKGLEEQSLNSDELGMYWKLNSGYNWYQLPIETHTLMIEVFNEVADDEVAVNDLKLWLLKNKQTSNWKTTKATSAAVYALLLNGDNWLLEDQDIEIKFGDKVFDQSNIKKEAGTGYFKVDWQPKDITADLSNISIANPNKSPAWGAMYWQYFEDLDNVKSFEDTPLKIVKTLYKEEITDEGPKLTKIKENGSLKPGDKIKVRIELRVDRAMEYVHMKDMRASGFEPLNVLSQYKWQGRLGYYESTKDAATNFFFSYLPKGTHVFEYPMRVIHKGDFSNGVTTVQCMYAPEFTSHSTGIRVKVD